MLRIILYLAPISYIYGSNTCPYCLKELIRYIYYLLFRPFAVNALFALIIGDLKSTILSVCLQNGKFDEFVDTSLTVSYVKILLIVPNLIISMHFLILILLISIDFSSEEGEVGIRACGTLLTDKIRKICVPVSSSILILLSSHTFSMAITRSVFIRLIPHLQNGMLIQVSLI